MGVVGEVVELETLIERAKVGDVDSVREAIRSDPRLLNARLPTGETPLIAALYRGHHAVVNALIDLGTDLDVFAAAATGRVSQLERSLQERAAVNAYSYDGWTPLHLAAFFGQRDAAALLLDAGADITAISRNGMKNTPLHAATAGKHTDVALLLLSRGADARTVDAGGYTPEKIASENQLQSVLDAIAARRS